MLPIIGDLVLAASPLPPNADSRDPLAATAFCHILQPGRINYDSLAEG